MNKECVAKSLLQEKWFQTDDSFNSIFPVGIQNQARRHWTPLRVAKKAARFLSTDSGVRILDIGSGIGKFCLAAAYYQPKASFFGIEQRRNLVEQAEKAKQVLQLDNAHFLYGNFTQVDFQHYDHFYFYNSFYENLSGTEKIDDSIDYSAELFNYYNGYLFRELEKKPAGTRLVTYHSLEDEVPPGYQVVGTAINDYLKFWIKI
ncbi:methyltransferase domain-containing protein [Flavihumibacter solisilvae]|uniref:methyltransferase domain-containing protein n=1 Tax=Flavihumibacter solisilvae TaxID=1349421 RepID=UPI00068EC6B9|nr:methyltransferase domain-containing protein [Flavihumibacter solisilvae]